MPQVMPRGDPTLTSMGTEQPFAGRLRLANQVRAWSLTTGQDAVDAVSLRELRMDLSVAYAPLHPSYDRWLDGVEPTSPGAAEQVLRNVAGSATIGP
ncbi:MAG TPA: hypothetical protein VEU33_15940 [Archangium sp.]|nr:hypothetical protein [Archangium sp.]